MTEPAKTSAAELFEDNALITAALQRAVREAVLIHAKLGRSVVAWEAGKVVWLQPEEILKRLESVSHK